MVLWEIGNIIFLTLAYHQKFREGKLLEEEIRDANDNRKLKVDENFLHKLIHKLFFSAIWFESIITSGLNSLVIAFEIHDSHHSYSLFFDFIGMQNNFQILQTQQRVPVGFTIYSIFCNSCSRYILFLSDIN